MLNLDIRKSRDMQEEYDDYGNGPQNESFIPPMTWRRKLWIEWEYWKGTVVRYFQIKKIQWANPGFSYDDAGKEYYRRATDELSKALRHDMLRVSGKLGFARRILDLSHVRPVGPPLFGTVSPPRYAGDKFAGLYHRNVDQKSIDDAQYDINKAAWLVHKTWDLTDEEKEAFKRFRGVVQAGLTPSQESCDAVIAIIDMYHGNALKE